MRQQLEQRIKQRINAAPRQAAQPLADLLNLGDELVSVWAGCTRLSLGLDIDRSQGLSAYLAGLTVTQALHIASVTQAISGIRYLSAVAAATAATWGCDAVLQACFNAAGVIRTATTITMDNTARALLAGALMRAHSFVAACGSKQSRKILQYHTSSEAAHSDCIPASWDPASGDGLCGPESGLQVQSAARPAPRSTAAHYPCMRLRQQSKQRSAGQSCWCCSSCATLPQLHPAGCWAGSDPAARRLPIAQ